MDEGEGDELERREGRKGKCELTSDEKDSSLTFENVYRKSSPIPRSTLPISTHPLPACDLV